MELCYSKLELITWLRFFKGILLIHIYTGNVGQQIHYGQTSSSQFDEIVKWWKPNPEKMLF